MLKFTQCIISLFVKLFLLGYSVFCCAIFTTAFFYGCGVVMYGSFTVIQFVFHVANLHTMDLSVFLKALVFIPFILCVALMLLALKKPQLWLKHYVDEAKCKQILQYKKSMSFLTSTLTALTGVLIVLLISPFSFERMKPEFAYAYNLFGQSKYDTIIDDNFVNPEKLQIRQSNKQNVIVIFVESLEQTFADKAIWGENLLPKLDLQKGKSIWGYERLTEISWSNAGLLATLCGVTDKQYFPSRSVSQDFVCISDVMQKSGYYTYYMQGTPLKFSGLDKFLSVHHFSKVEGVDELSVVDNGNKVHKDRYSALIGDVLDDKKLLDIFRQKITEIANTHQPFIAITATMNTHPYHGHVSLGCEKKYNDMRDAILCSDKELSDFVAWFEAQDFYDNTTLVLMGDHPMMYSDIQPYMDRVKHHATLNLMWGAGAPKESIKKPFNQFDWAPTLLEMAGFEWRERKFGLGTSLLSEEKTMQEKYGKDLDARLLNNSKLYDEQIFVK